MTFYEALKVFPEAKGYLKEQNKSIQHYLKENERVRKQCEDVIYRKAKKSEEEWWNMIAEVLIIKTDREVHWKKIWKRNDAVLNPPKINGKVITNEMVQRAKQYPIEELIEFNKSVARCVFHTEKTASLHYYKKQNKCHCFGCNKSYDSIAIYQQLNNCSFVQAVERLQ